MLFSHPFAKLELLAGKKIALVMPEEANI